MPHIATNNQGKKYFFSCMIQHQQLSFFYSGLSHIHTYTSQKGPWKACHRKAISILPVTVSSVKRLKLKINFLQNLTALLFISELFRHSKYVLTVIPLLFYNT